MAETAKDPLTHLRGKKWEELELLEHDGRILFRDTLRKRAKGGDGWIEMPVLVQVLRKNERRAARLEAREWARRAGVDVEKDPALFEDLDNICILARSIRDTTPINGVYPQHCSPEDLEVTYDAPSLEAIWQRLEAYRDMLDPGLKIVDEHTFFGALAAIDQAGNMLPLAGIESRAQSSFLLRTVRAALASPMAQSYFMSPESLTSERSRSNG